MLKMSFYNGTLDREKLREFILTTEKPIKYTIGLMYRNPTTKRVPVTKEEALAIIEDSWLDADEYEDYLHLNTFNANDMY